MDGRKDKIDSVMNLRHQIAHGKSTGITLAKLKEYFHCAKDVIEFIRREHC